MFYGEIIKKLNSQIADFSREIFYFTDKLIVTVVLNFYRLSTGGGLSGLNADI